MLFAIAQKKKKRQYLGFVVLPVVRLRVQRNKIIHIYRYIILLAIGFLLCRKNQTKPKGMVDWIFSLGFEVSWFYCAVFVCAFFRERLDFSVQKTECSFLINFCFVKFCENVNGVVEVVDRWAHYAVVQPG